MLRSKMLKNDGVNQMELKHTVVVEWNRVTMTLQKTQTELADLLKLEGVRLISVNATGNTYRKRRTNKKAKPSVS